MSSAEDRYISLVAAVEHGAAVDLKGRMDDALDGAFSSVLQTPEFQALASRVGVSIAASMAVGLLTESIHIWAVEKYQALRADYFQREMGFPRSK